MHLSDPVQQRLRKRYERVAGAERASHIARAVAVSGLACFDGDTGKARKVLRKALRDHGIPPVDARTWRNNLVIAAMICDDFKLVGELLASIYEPGTSIRVSLMNRNKPVGPGNVFRCVIRGPKRMVFKIPASAGTSSGFMTLVSRWVHTVPLFEEVARVHGGRSGRISLSLVDGAKKRGVGFCTKSKKVTLIPDPEYLRTNAYEALRVHLRDNPLAWSARKPIALWRGSTNGFPEESKGWETLPRAKMCRLVQGDGAELFDVGITSCTRPTGDAAYEELPRSGLMKPSMNVRLFNQYRYQIDIDGFTNAWSGLFQKLLTGSTVLKVQSEWRQWYYDRMVPWTHFVPVANDMSDLVEKVRWLVAHDDKAEQIGAAGKAFAESLDHDSESARAAEIVSRALAA